jgi:DNA-binding GntR family transcriptional regulator
MIIADELRQQIIDGTLAPGARFPTLAEIQEKYGVAEGTAYQATRVLLNEGLTVTKPGAQTRVRELPDVIRLVRSWYRESRSGSPWHADMAAQGRVGAQTSHTDEIDAPPAIAERLFINPGDPVMRTVYIYVAEEKPIFLCTSYEPANLTDESPVVLPEGGPRHIRDIDVVERMALIGLNVTRVVEEIVPRTLTAKEAERLRLRAGIAIVVIERTYFAGSRPVETADLVITPTYRARYEIPIGDE